MRPSPNDLIYLLLSPRAFSAVGGRAALRPETLLLLSTNFPPPKSTLKKTQVLSMWFKMCRGPTDSSLSTVMYVTNGVLSICVNRHVCHRKRFVISCQASYISWKVFCSLPATILSRHEGCQVMSGRMSQQLFVENPTI